MCAMIHTLYLKHCIDYSYIYQEEIGEGQVFDITHWQHCAEGYDLTIRWTLRTTDGTGTCPTSPAQEV